MRGHEAILRQFLANDLDHMFGNPGTVEQGFLDALADVPEMKYILTLQEDSSLHSYKYTAHLGLEMPSVTCTRRCEVNHPLW